MNKNHHAPPALQVFLNDTLIFSHNGNWLHPLFALESFLEENPHPAEELNLQDKIIGKAAAMLIYRLGIRRVFGALISEPAVRFLQERDVDLTWKEQVPRIACRTEEIFRDIDDPEEAYGELRSRAGLT